MGYRGKVRERAAARKLRARGWTLREIADELGVAKSSVSVWVRDVEFTPRRRPSGRRSRNPGANKLRRRKLAEIARLKREGVERIGRLSEREFLVAGAALYAGEGSKRDGQIGFANSDPRMLLFFLAWLRRFFEVDESRLRMHLYLHQGLDLEGTNAYWSELTEIPVTQFLKPYRAVPDAGIRNTKHIRGCPRIRYGCARTHRAVMGLVEALLAPAARADVSPEVTAQTSLVPTDRIR